MAASLAELLARSTPRTREVVERVLEWQVRNGVQTIPKKHDPDDDEQMRLGQRFAKLLLRRHRFLGSGRYPSEKQLCDDDVALVDAVPGVPARGCSCTLATSGSSPEPPSVSVQPGGISVADDVHGSDSCGLTKTFGGHRRPLHSEADESAKRQCITTSFSGGSSFSIHGSVGPVQLPTESGSNVNVSELLALATTPTRKLVEAVLAWQQRVGVLTIPCQKSCDEEERLLGKRFVHLLTRRHRSVSSGSKPSDRQLCEQDVALVNCVPGVPARGCSKTGAASSVVGSSILQASLEAVSVRSVADNGCNDMIGADTCEDKAADSISDTAHLAPSTGESFADAASHGLRVV